MSLSFTTPTAMTRDDFTLALEQELRLRGVRFSRADLMQFVADCWPRIVDDPDVPRWAQEFIDSGRADVIT
jgi:hypothetical protein